MGRRIWIHVELDGIVFDTNEVRVTGFKNFFPADKPGPKQKRKKHLVQLWTDPGGMRTLSVGAIQLKNPGRVAAGNASAAAARARTG